MSRGGVDGGSRGGAFGRGGDGDGDSEVELSAIAEGGRAAEPAADGGGAEGRRAAESTAAAEAGASGAPGDIESGACKGDDDSCQREGLGNESGAPTRGEEVGQRIVQRVAGR